MIELIQSNRKKFFQMELWKIIYKNKEYFYEIKVDARGNLNEKTLKHNNKICDNNLSSLVIEYFERSK
jgi:hypothetical protein